MASSSWMPISVGATTQPSTLLNSPWAPVSVKSASNVLGGYTPAATTQTATDGTTGVTAPTYPALPDYSAQTGQDLSNISSLLNPSYDDMNEVRMKSAANSYAQGTSGSAFAYNGLLKMLDSEKIAREQLGSQLLQPYLQQKTTLQTATMAQQGENYRAILAGQQAMDRLKLSEQGLSARLTQEEQAALQQTVVKGQQALEQISLTGQYGLAHTNLNPLTQQKLASNLTGNGSAIGDSQAITNKYSGANSSQTLYGDQSSANVVDVGSNTPSMFDVGSSQSYGYDAIPSDMSLDDINSWLDNYYYYGE